MTDLIRNALVPIAALHPHTRNYRKHPEAQIARIMASLQRFGQVRSVVAQEGADGRYLLVAGHGLTTAAQQLGLAELRVDVIPASWSAADIEGYLVADNSTSLGAEDDLIELAQLLEEQKHAGYDLASLGFTEEGLDQLLADLADEALDEKLLPTFKDFDETIEDDLPTEMCDQCGKLCLKPGAKVKS